MAELITLASIRQYNVTMLLLIEYKQNLSEEQAGRTDGTSNKIAKKLHINSASIHKPKSDVDLKNGTSQNKKIMMHSTN